MSAIEYTPLTMGQHAIVDLEDYEWLKEWHWHARKQKQGNKIAYYATREGKNKRPIRMAREIMKAPEGYVVDHVNHNTLDNRKENLRVVTKRQNTQNLSIAQTSQYPGVCFHKTAGKWMAQITIKNRNYYLGLFKEEIDAAKAYEQEVRKLGQELVCKVKKVS